ncbi:12121_t:CDS:10 [Gigaspora rosea]|nr:12121_t:CDS:10 [Gigaspora rosea]
MTKEIQETPIEVSSEATTLQQENNNEPEPESKKDQKQPEIRKGKLTNRNVGQEYIKKNGPPSQKEINNQNKAFFAYFNSKLEEKIDKKLTTSLSRVLNKKVHEQLRLRAFTLKEAEKGGWTMARKILKPIPNDGNRFKDLLVEAKKQSKLQEKYSIPYSHMASVCALRLVERSTREREHKERDNEQHRAEQEACWLKNQIENKARKMVRERSSMLEKVGHSRESGKVKSDSTGVKLQETRICLKTLTDMDWVTVRKLIQQTGVFGNGLKKFGCQTDKDEYILVDKKFGKYSEIGKKGQLPGNHKARGQLNSTGAQKLCRLIEVEKRDKLYVPAPVFGTKILHHMKSCRARTIVNQELHLRPDLQVYKTLEKLEVEILGYLHLAIKDLFQKAKALAKETMSLFYKAKAKKYWALYEKFYRKFKLNVDNLQNGIYHMKIIRGDAVLRHYMDVLQPLASGSMYRRDVALVALGLRTMRRPSELEELTMKDIRPYGF